MQNKAAYNPQDPAVKAFMAELSLLSLSDQGWVVNHPWPAGCDSPEILQLKGKWRRLRSLPEQPFESGT